jgi:hypothetical protein
MIYRPIASPSAINNRTGQGFVFTDANNDGIDDNDGVSRLILQGHITDIFGSFVGTGTNAPVLDPTTGSPPAGPLNPQTRIFSGSTAVTVSIDFSNPLFFPDPKEMLTKLNFTTQNVTPFNAVGANISGVFFEGSQANLTGVNGVDGTNALFQADANAATTLVCVPLDEAGNPVPVDKNGVPLTTVRPAALVGGSAGGASGGASAPLGAAGPAVAPSPAGPTSPVLGSAMSPTDAVFAGMAETGLGVQQPSLWTPGWSQVLGGKRHDVWADLTE